MGGGSGSQSEQFSSSDAQSSTFVDPAQAGFLGGLRSAAGGALESQISSGGTQGNVLSQDMLARSLGLLDSATGGDAEAAQIGTLGTSLGRFFDQGLNKIGNRFGRSGTGTPGARAGIEGEELLGRAGDSFAGGVADILGAGADRNVQAAGLSPSLFNLGISGFQGAALPALALSQILGDPTILSQSTATSRGRGSSESTSVRFF